MRGVMRGPLRHGGYIFLIDATRPVAKEELALHALAKLHQGMGHDVRVVGPNNTCWEQPAQHDD
eukprot:10622120-Alexandrium_andersonii.AAC.1